MQTLRRLSLFEDYREQEGSQALKRPHPPALLALALSLWGAAAFAYRGAQGLPSGLLLAAAFSMLGLSVLLVAVLLRLGGPIRVCVALGISAGLAIGAFAALQMYAQRDAAAVLGWQEFRFEVVEDPSPGSFGSSCLAKAETSGTGSFLVRLSFTGQGPDLAYGSIFTASTQMQAPSEGSAQYCWERGVAASARIRSFETLERGDAMAFILGFRNTALSLYDRFEGEGAALLRALLFGERARLNGMEVSEEIKVAGLAHMVAVSGAHLAVIASFLALALKSCGAPRRAAIGIQLGFLLLYLVCTGIPVSALRATCMVAVSSLSLFSRRRPSSMSALSLCICAFVVLDPVGAQSLSFILSAGSTLGIILFGSYFKAWCALLPFGSSGIVSEGLSLTSASSVLSLPVMVAEFSRISLIAPLANIVAAPFFMVLCAGGLLSTCLGVVLPGISTYLLMPVVVLAEAFCETVALMASAPFASIPAFLGLPGAVMLSGVMALVLWKAWPRPSPKRLGLFAFSAFMAVLLVVLVFPRFTDDELIMLDVGQGDAFVVRSRGSAVLIDTGTLDMQLVEHLAKNGVYRLDAVFVSHADDDHCGSLKALKGVVGVGRVCVSSPTFDCPCTNCRALLVDAGDLVGSGQVVGLTPGDSIRVGAFTLEVKAPEKFSDQGGNDDSLGILLTHGSAGRIWTALMCGDLEAEGLERMLQGDQVGEVDILKVSHHGSKNSLTKQLLKRLAPEVGLISVGSGNRYGHPAREVIALLEEQGCKVMRTDQEGDVVCKFTPERILVRSLG